jgi:D-alanyl-lipoteichoic acid acyltransferase DltB (MBOAT superfamily)
MAFLSLEFLLFFALTAALHRVLPSRFRNLFLLLAGYFFYATNQRFGLLLLVGSTLIDFFLARAMAAQTGPRSRKRLLILGLAVNLAILAAFKYAGFISASFDGLLTRLHVSHASPALRLVLPLGISYYTFKKISYLVDVYRRKLPVERSFSRLALYVSFFPAIQAGPMDRAGDLMTQFPAPDRPDPARLVEGLQLIVWGLFKKLVVADRLAALVNTVFEQPGTFRGPVIALAACAYSWQIYCDFSAYTDLARGLGRILGFRLMENFRHPYLARSIGDFWRRWHISLSTWLRDYLFLPVSYSLSRRFSRRTRLAPQADRLAYVTGVTLTMALCGLWHGAGWTFVAWGLVQGLFLAFSLLTKTVRRRAAKALRLDRHPGWRDLWRVAACFLMVSFSWIFFRAASLRDAFTLIADIFARPAGVSNTLTGRLLAGRPPLELAAAGLAVIALVAVERLLERADLHELLAAQPVWRRWLAYYLVIFAVLLFGVYAQPEFIYGRF